MKLLYTCGEVCEMLGVNIKVVYRLIREKKLGCVKLHSKGFHFTPEQVEDLIRLLTIPAKAPNAKAGPVHLEQKKARKPKAGAEARKQDVDKATLRNEMREWQ
ncbi:MAG: helix-turn-helix domain-containing protein [Desulfomonilaceae bacterium]